MHRLILPTYSFIARLHLNILLSCIVSAKFADTPVWGIIGTPADTPSNLTFTLSPCQSTGQIDWHAWSIFHAWRTLALEFQCVDFCVNTSFQIRGNVKFDGVLAGVLIIPQISVSGSFADTIHDKRIFKYKRVINECVGRISRCTRWQNQLWVVDYACVTRSKLRMCNSDDVN